MHAGGSSLLVAFLVGWHATGCSHPSIAVLLDRTDPDVVRRANWNG